MCPFCFVLLWRRIIVTCMKVKWYMQGEEDVWPYRSAMYSISMSTLSQWSSNYRHMTESSIVTRTVVMTDKEADRAKGQYHRYSMQNNTSGLSSYACSPLCCASETTTMSDITYMCLQWYKYDLCRDIDPKPREAYVWTETFGSYAKAHRCWHLWQVSIWVMLL
jgi:hypothetical protein